MVWIRWCFLSMMLIIGACGETDQPAVEPFTVEDSAGVEVVSSVEPVWTSADRWRVEPEPFLVLGIAQEGEAPVFYNVSGVAALSDGRIVVGSDATKEVLIFSPDGAFLDDLGGQGEGPGEFQAIGWLGTRDGESILVFDYFNDRLTVLDSEGFPARTVQASVGWNYWPYGVTNDGIILFRSPGETSSREAVSGVYWDSTWVVAFDPEDASADSIGRFRNAERMGTLGDVAGYHFGLRMRLAVGPEGFYMGWGDAFEIREYAVEGGLRRIIRRNHEPIEVTDEVLGIHERSYMAEMELAAPPDAQQEDFDRLQRRHQESEYRSELPAFRQLEIDPDGNLWAEHYPPHFRRRGQEEATWSVFTPSGRWLGTVDVPPRLEVHQIGRDFVLGLFVDELGVEYVHMHELHRD